MSNLLHFPRVERKPRAAIKIEIDLPAPLADKLTVSAGYACKSPSQWASDALTAVLQMGGYE